MIRRMVRAHRPHWGAAAEATIDLAGGARACGRSHRRAHIVVGEHVTGHTINGLAAARLVDMNYLTSVRAGGKEKKHNLTYSNVALWKPVRPIL